MRAIIDLFAALIQIYISVTILCEIFHVKKPYERSFFWASMQLLVSYFGVNYVFNSTPLERITCGTIIYIIFGLIYLEGNRAIQILTSIVQYFMMLGLDLALQFLMFPNFTDVIMKLPPLDQKLIGRNVGLAGLFIFHYIYQLFSKQKEGVKGNAITILALVFGMVQVVILNILTLSNPDDVLQNRLFITAIFSMIMLGGYMVVDELFKQMLKQRKKQMELEQMALEKEYQYDYYKKAVAQSERLRDLRHDMRNQLQTVEYLIQSESEEDRKRAEEMAAQVSKKFIGKIND